MKQKTTKWIILAAIATAALSLTACRKSADPNAASASSQALPIVVSGTTDSAASSIALPTIPAGNAAANSSLSTEEANSGAAAVDSSAAAASEIDKNETDNGEPSGEGNTGTLNAGVNFRSSASNDDDDNIIDTIEEGEEVTILGKEGEWYHIEYNGEEGYVKSEYID